MHIPNLKQRLTTRFTTPLPRPTFKCERIVKTQVLDVDTDVVNENLEIKTFNRCEEMKQYKYSDFSLNNLIAIGAPLDDVKLSSSALSTADNLVNVLSNLPDLENMSNE